MTRVQILYGVKMFGGYPNRAESSAASAAGYAEHSGFVGGVRDGLGAGLFAKVDSQCHHIAAWWATRRRVLGGQQRRHRTYIEGPHRPAPANDTVASPREGPGTPSLARRASSCSN